MTPAVLLRYLRGPLLKTTSSSNRTTQPPERRPAHALPNFREYACEAAGTAFNVFVGLSAATFDFAPGLPMEHLIPSVSVRLLITGLIFAGSGSLFAISPLGKLSGAHINPSVSLAFFVRGKMRTHDFAGYVVAQFLGALAAAGALRAVWQGHFRNVHDGMTLPGVGYPLPVVFMAEFFMTGALVFAIFTFVSSPRLMRWTPLMNWFLVAVMVWLGAPVSGTSLNPARSLAPAAVAWFWHYQWLYAVAPLLGALTAVGLFRIFAYERRILTAKLFHAPHYPSIFKNLHVPCLVKRHWRRFW